MQVSTAFILAAGFGSRLRPLTDTVPKPMIEVGGRPLIHYAFDIALNAGATRLVVNTHHLVEKIESGLGASYENAQIVYSREKEILGSAGGIGQMLGVLGEVPERVLVLNSDTLMDLDIASMLSTHKNSKADATLLLRQSKDQERYGLLGFDSSYRIHSILERGRTHSAISDFGMFCGLQILEASILKRMPVGRFASTTQEIFPSAIEADLHFQAHLHLGYFNDVGTHERLNIAREDASLLKALNLRETALE